MKIPPGTPEYQLGQSKIESPEEVSGGGLSAWVPAIQGGKSGQWFTPLALAWPSPVYCKDLENEQQMKAVTLSLKNHENIP